VFAAKSAMLLLKLLSLARLLRLLAEIGVLPFAVEEGRRSVDKFTVEQN
jgi:hypothetical protein